MLCAGRVRSARARERRAEKFLSGGTSSRPS